MSVESYRESPGKFDSRTLSRETLSRWTGRRAVILPSWQGDRAYVQERPKRCLEGHKHREFPPNSHVHREFPRKFRVNES